MQTLDSIIDQVKTLPPAPRILPQLLAALGREDSDASEVVQLVLFDPALTAQVVRRCNSAQYAFAEPAQNLHEAVTRLGMSEIYRLVASVLGERVLAAVQPGYGLGLGELWKHSAAAAVAARIIMRQAGGDESLAFTAALLHDIGKLVLNSGLEGQYEKVMEKTEEGHLSFLEAERAILGFDHAEAGGRLLQRWNFSANIVSAVRHHHDPRDAAADVRLAACVHLSDVLAHLLGYGYGHQAYAVRDHAEVFDILKLDSAGIDQLLILTMAGVDAALSPIPA